MLTRDTMQGLFEAGLVYRHDLERWAMLQGQETTLYPSPTRRIQAGAKVFMEELIQPLLAPMVLEQKEVEQLELLAKAWKALTQAQFVAVTDGLRDRADEYFRRLAQRLVPENQRSVAMRHPGYSELIAPFVRLDLVRTLEGFKVVDINLTRPAGTGDYFLLDEFYARYSSEAYQRFATAKHFCGVVKQCFQSWCGHNGCHEKARLAVLIDEGAGDWTNFRVLGELLRREGWVETVEMISEVPEPTDTRFNCLLRSRIKFGHPLFNRLLALPVERFCVISPPERRFLGNKFWFVALREPEMQSWLKERLGPHYEIIDKAIPETGVLKDGFVEFPDRVVDTQSINRKEWIIKPPSGSSGKGILIGRHIQKWKWDEFCASPLANGSIVQRYYRCKEEVPVLNTAGEPTKILCYIKYGAFLFGGNVAGCEVMARQSSLVHGARDTYFSTCVWK